MNQIAARVYLTREVSRRLSVSMLSLHKWTKPSGDPAPNIPIVHQEAEVRRLNWELAWVT